MKNRRKRSGKKRLAHMTVYTILILCLYGGYKDTSLIPVLIPSLVGLAAMLFAIKKYQFGQGPEEK